MIKITGFSGVVLNLSRFSRFHKKIIQKSKTLVKALFDFTVDLVKADSELKRTPITVLSVISN